MEHFPIVETIEFGSIKLDGGAMFGMIPKPIWSKLIIPDDQNRIKLSLRGLLISFRSRTLLVDSGCGTYWSEKLNSRFGIQENELKFTPDQITDILLTHFHFDHAGGLTKKNSEKITKKELVNNIVDYLPTFQNANIWVSEQNYLNAITPNDYEKYSYRECDLILAKNKNLFKFKNLDTNCQIQKKFSQLFPNITLAYSNGHTKGLIWLKIETKDKIIFYPSDLMPTKHHLSLSYNMGYDMNSELILKEKKQLLQAIEKEKMLSDKNIVIIFNHDPENESLKVFKHENLL